MKSFSIASKATNTKPQKFPFFCGIDISVIKILWYRNYGKNVGMVMGVYVYVYLPYTSLSLSIICNVAEISEISVDKVRRDKSRIHKSVKDNKYCRVG